MRSSVELLPVGAIAGVSCCWGGNFGKRFSRNGESVSGGGGGGADRTLKKLLAVVDNCNNIFPAETMAG